MRSSGNSDGLKRSEEAAEAGRRCGCGFPRWFSGWVKRIGGGRRGGMQGGGRIVRVGERVLELRKSSLAQYDSGRV